MVVVNEEEVIKVAADLSCGVHAGVDIKLRPIRKRRKCIRQHGGLNPGCQGKLGTDSLFFRRDFRQVFYVRLDLLFHVIDGTGESADLIFVGDFLLKLDVGCHIFIGEARGFRNNLPDGMEQRPVQIQGFYNNYNDPQKEKRQQHPVKVSVSGGGHAVHLPLYAENGGDFPVGGSQGNHHGDVRVGFNIAFVTDDDFSGRTLLTDGAVLHPVVVVGGFPQVTEVVKRVVAVLVLGGEQELDMIVIRAVRQNHIDKCGAGSVAEPVHG